MHFGLTRLERKLFRTDILPIAFGLLFGLSVVLPVNIPIPTKIATTLVLPPIDIVARFGAHPACAEVGRGCAIGDAVSSDSTGAQAPTADHRLTPHQRNHSGPSAAIRYSTAPLIAQVGILSWPVLTHVNIRISNAVKCRCRWHCLAQCQRTTAAVRTDAPRSQGSWPC